MNGREERWPRLSVVRHLVLNKILQANMISQLGNMPGACRV